MTAEEKKQMIEQLNEIHSATVAILEEIDLETRVYKDSDWRVIDIIGHIATWNRQVMKSLKAFRSGNEYSIPDLEDEEDNYNAQAVLELRVLSNLQIYSRWEQAFEELKITIQEMPLDKFPGDLLFPWGNDRGSIAGAVDFTIEHEVEHRDQIMKAIQLSQKV